jgi:hypothetical protein
MGWDEQVARAPDDELLVWAPLATIASELRNPATADPRWIALSCTILSGWASRIGARQAALLFAEAAALGCPTDPHFAWSAGDMYLREGHLQHAERWLRRSSRIAVWYRNWDAQTAALSSLGAVAKMAGRDAEAEKLLSSALRIARRAVLREREARLCHDLLLLAARSDDVRKAERFATEGMLACAPSDPTLIPLARDIAALWFRHNRFGTAAQVFKALLPQITAPDERLHVAAHCARAAGAVSDAETFRVSSMEAWMLIDAGSVEAQHPVAALAIGLGALDLACWNDARHALTSAVHSATLAGNKAVAEEARAALQRVPTNQLDGLTPGSGPRTRRMDATESLAAEFVRKLESRTDSVPGPETGPVAVEDPTVR